MKDHFAGADRGCPDCEVALDGITRRSFLQTTTAALAAAAGGGWTAMGQTQPQSAETLVQTFYKSLTPVQRAAICMPFEHERRLKVDNSWFVTGARIGKDFTPDQQQMLREVFRSLHSPEYADPVWKATVHDAGQAGFGGLSVGLFGEPGSGKFECVLSGRHVTRRCDGDSVEGAAFGGPIFYGHAALSDEEAADHPENIYWYQAVRANEVFQAMDGKQRKRALLQEGRPERGADTVKLSGKRTGLPGIAVGELSRDQRDLVRKVMADLLAPFRKSDATEAMRLVEANGFENLHLAFFKNDDIGNDGVWDVWQIEGPSVVCYFRGSPHVHAWMHIRA